MAVNQRLHDYMRSLGISEKEISLLSLGNYYGDRKALQQAIDQAIANARASRMTSGDEDEEYDEYAGDDAEYLDDESEDDDAGDVGHLPAQQKPSKAEKRERQLMEATERLARAEGVTLSELRHTATYGTPEAQSRASLKIQQLQRRASYTLSE